MDDTERKMTKIAREVSKFTVQTMNILISQNALLPSVKKKLTDL